MSLVVTVAMSLIRPFPNAWLLMPKEKIKSLYVAKTPSRYMEVVSFGGHKFKYHIEFTNGDPCGFNYKQSISVMTSDGAWTHLVDSRELNASQPNNYVGQDSVKVSMRNKLLVVFNDYIEKVYG